MKGKKKRMRAVITHLAMIVLGIIMLYPLIWMFFASFKTNQEIFGSLSLLPKSRSGIPIRRAFRGQDRLPMQPFS